MEKDDTAHVGLDIMLCISTYALTSPHHKVPSTAAPAHHTPTNPTQHTPTCSPIRSPGSSALMTNSGSGGSSCALQPSPHSSRRLAAYSSGNERSSRRLRVTVTGSSRPTCRTYARMMIMMVAHARIPSYTSIPLVLVHTHLHTSTWQMCSHRQKHKVTQHTVRQMGQRFLTSVHRAKQGLQKEWPHGVVTGSYSSRMHSTHSLSSHISSCNRLCHNTRCPVRCKVRVVHTPRHVRFFLFTPVHIQQHNTHTPLAAAGTAPAYCPRPRRLQCRLHRGVGGASCLVVWLEKKGVHEGGLGARVTFQEQQSLSLQ